MKEFDPSSPSMTVIRRYRMPDGTIREIIDPEYERRYREHLLSTSANPTWRNDPTYNMRKKK